MSTSTDAGQRCPKCGGTHYSVDGPNSPCMPPMPSVAASRLANDMIAGSVKSPDFPGNIQRAKAASAAALTSTGEASDEVLADAGGAGTLAARTLLQEFVVSLTEGGKNRRNCLSINHDRLAELVAEATATLFANPVPVDAGGALPLGPDPRGTQCLCCRQWQETTSAGYCATCIKSGAAHDRNDRVAAIDAGQTVLKGRGDGTYAEAENAIRLLIAALAHTAPAAPTHVAEHLAVANAAPVAEAGVLAGMVLVPVEPSRAMCIAAAERTDIPLTPKGAAEVWSAMLAAAPKQATPTDEAVLALMLKLKKLGDLQLPLEAQVGLGEIYADAAELLNARPAPGSAGEAGDA